MYDYVVVTHIPSFYKVNFYNELAKKMKIMVIFIANNTNEKRADDFITLKKADFEYKVLFDGNFQDRKEYKNIRKLKKIFKNLDYKKILLSGWDLKEFWYLLFTTSISKNCLALESTVLESNTGGMKGFIKKIFLTRISTVFASGNLHVELLKELKYKNDIKITKGVGIINKPGYINRDKEYKKRFLYVGRLSKVKNLKNLIDIFNDLNEYSLTIIGIGEEEKYLKKIANKNIKFIGSVANENLKEYFLDNDIFLLPSISEPWGLVVEEALYFGLPVIISQNCGSCELIENNLNGYIVNPNNKNSIKNIINKIDARIYKKLKLGVKRFSIDEKDKIQVAVYL